MRTCLQALCKPGATLYLLDEPTANLAPDATATLIKCLAELAKKESTSQVCIISHDADVYQKLANLLNGQVQIFTMPSRDAQGEQQKVSVRDIVPFANLERPRSKTA